MSGKSDKAGKCNKMIEVCSKSLDSLNFSLQQV